VNIAEFRTRAQGKHATIPTGVALRLIGKREEVHPRDAWACVWRDAALAEFSCQANREHYGHRVWGPVMTDGGLLEVVDLRPALEREGLRLTDPALPDDWKP